MQDTGSESTITITEQEICKNFGFPSAIINLKFPTPSIFKLSFKIIQIIKK